MRELRLATLMILLMWILFGPLGMVLSGCMMMDGCDALCSLPSFAPVSAPALPTQTTSVLDPDGVAFVPQNVWSVPDSPPKPIPTLL